MYKSSNNQVKIKQKEAFLTASRVGYTMRYFRDLILKL